MREEKLKINKNTLWAIAVVALVLGSSTTIYARTLRNRIYESQPETTQSQYQNPVTEPLQEVTPNAQLNSNYSQQNLWEFPGETERQSYPEADSQVDNETHYENNELQDQTQSWEQEQGYNGHTSSENLETDYGNNFSKPKVTGKTALFPNWYFMNVEIVTQDKYHWSKKYYPRATDNNKLKFNVYNNGDTEGPEVTVKFSLKRLSDNYIVEKTMDIGFVEPKKDHKFEIGGPGADFPGPLQKGLHILNACFVDPVQQKDMWGGKCWPEEKFYVLEEPRPEFWAEKSLHWQPPKEIFSGKEFPIEFYVLNHGDKNSAGVMTATLDDQLIGWETSQTIPTHESKGQFLRFKAVPDSAGIQNLSICINYPEGGPVKEMNDKYDNNCIKYVVEVLPDPKTLRYQAVPGTELKSSKKTEKNNFKLKKKKQTLKKRKKKI